MTEVVNTTLEKIPWSPSWIKDAPQELRSILGYQWEEIARYLNKFSMTADGVATDSNNGYVVDLTDAANIASDASLVDGSPRKIFAVTLGGNRTLSNPTNAKPGQPIIYRIKQPAAGNKTLSLDTGFVSGSISVTLSTGNNAVDYLGILCRSNNTFDVVSFVKGY